MTLTEIVKEKALELGFDAVGITNAAPLGREQAEYLRGWLAEGKAADMAYLYRSLDKRLAPESILPEARSILCVAISYRPPVEDASLPSGAAVIADYATWQDYHTFMRDKLYLLAEAIRVELGSEFAFKVCVDSSPIAERSLAVRSGLGFIGRNRMLIHPRLGPALFLAELVTDLKLDADAPIHGDCGSCRACLDACPTGAISESGLDARKCLSYLTIEHKADIPQEFARKMGCRLFGCDECVHACPFYAQSPECSDETLMLRTGERYFDAEEVLEWDERTYKTKSAGTPLTRPGLSGLKRNAAICTGNSRRH
jgi:epoxyqueuosine reductase